MPVVGARCVSGERQRREGFGAHGGVWEARRWVSRTQFTQKHNPRTQDAQASTDSREGRDSNDSQKPALGTRKANAMTASSVSSS